MLAVVCLAVGGLGLLRAAEESPKPAEPGPEARGKAADSHGDPLPPGALARLGTTRLRHGGDVTFVAFGSDGKTLLTAGQDDTIRLWDLATGKEVRRFDRPKPLPLKPPGKGDAPLNKPADEKVDAEAMLQLMAGGGNDGSRLLVALSPDGKTLAASSRNVIQLWEVETGRDLRRLEAPADGVVGLLLSPDGKTLAARGGSGSFVLWATDTGKEISRIKPPPRQGGNGIVLILGGGGDEEDAPGMAFSPDSKVLAAAATDRDKEVVTNSVKFHDVASGKEVRKIKAPEGVAVSGLAFAADGKILAFGGGNLVHLCEADTGKEIRQLKAPGGIRGLVFAPDGKTLAVQGRNRRVRLWETATGKELYQRGDAEQPAESDGVFFISGFAGPETRALAFSPDGKQFASAAGSTVRLWETATGKELPLLEGHRKAPLAIALSGDGKTVVSWGTDRVLRRWESATGKSLGEFPAPQGTTLAVLSPDGQTAALANADNTIRFLETSTGKERFRIKGLPNGAATLGFSPDGKVLAVRGGESTIRLYDAANGSELRQIVLRPGNNPPPNGVIIIGGRGRRSGGSGPGLVFSPDGKLLVAPGPNNGNARATLVIIDVSTGKELRKIASTQAVRSFAFSPDGRSLATENADRTVTLWEVASAKERGQMGKPVAAQEQPNGGRMGLRFVIEGLDAGEPAEPAGPVGLAFSPDGGALAVRGPDQSVHVWDVTGGKEIGQFKGHRGRIETVAFAADGKTLASGSTDTTMLLWDTAGVLKDMPKPQAVELAAGEVARLWTDLAGEDGVKARQGILKLAGAPGQVVPFLGEHLQPAATIDPQKIKGWIAGLDDDQYDVRQEASANLLKAGEQAVPALQKVLASSPPLETRRRAELLVDKLTGGTLTVEQLQLLRAVEALERMGTPEARTILRTLAGGAPGALPTREAQAALSRMKDLAKEERKP
jgi:WD40 repeat protein